MPEIKKYKPWYAHWWGAIFIILAALISIVAVAFSFQILNYYNQIKQAQNNPEGLPAFKADSYGDKTRELMIKGYKNYSFGTSSPVLTIVEFGDFNCPLCKNSYSTIRSLGQKYKKKVKVIFRDFPVYEESIELASAARCAGEQGLFWPMYDKFYQFQDNFDSSDLPELANQIGADTEQFNNCLNNGKYLDLIQKDYTNGTDLGVTGTPTWFFNGYMVAGDIPYDTFEAIILQFLK